MFFDPAQFPFTARLSAAWRDVLAEYERLPRERLIQWPERDLYNQGWDVLGLYGFGERIEANCRLCPQTAALIEAIPGMTTAGFSLLGSGTHIRPHEGYTSSVLRCHLGLIVPPNCGLKVGEETRTWRPGECLVFDDTIRHSAWNDAPTPRVVLLVDFLKPGQAYQPPATAAAQAALRAGKRPPG